MIDCSRNGVLLRTKVEEILVQMALMGSNMLQLYTEDTYQIEGEPFFGYFRGPYTQEELKTIDDFAFNLGIEVIPCIQTLGHLGQILQWSAYGGIRDTADVMLPQWEATYVLIEKMIKTITEPLRSKRIHVGMDESYGMGSGRFRQIFGYKDSIQIFVEHLARVKKICERIGVQPMIWSDMLFCFAAKNLSLSAYYDANNPTTEQMTENLPDEVEYVYWDYYHTLPQGYSNKIRHHWELSGKAPWVATGIWTWSRFWTGLPFTFSTIKACLNACKRGSGVKHTMATIWGDEGNEYDVWSALPGILYFAEQCYTLQEEVDANILKMKFDGISGGDWADYLYACKVDDLRPEDQPIGPGTTSTPNLGKWLLWEEPFFGLFTRQYDEYDLESHYTSLARYLEDCLSTNVSSMNPDHSLPKAIEDFPANRRLKGPYLLAKVLALKAHLRQHLSYYYDRKDMIEVAALAGPEPESRLSRLIVAVDELWKYHREMWMSTYKPFGWEILEIRYGALRSRLDTMRWRVSKYLDPTDPSVTSLEELEVPNEDLGNGQGVTVMLEWHRVSRATAY
ncbi:glycoside hydrolase family 20 protein [Atractiella rhizophila]|nr:glycoside hydrolase family 20 protein [Atractiella rhizophila]